MKVEDQIVFTAHHGSWKVADRLLDMDDEKVAHFIASIANTVNAKIPEYLTEVMNVAGIMSLAGELAKKDLGDAIIALKSPGTARKLGQLVFEEDKKLKKHLVEVAKALLVREVLSKKVPVEYPEEPLSEVRIVFPYNEDHINFVAFHVSGKTKWRAVRRLIIDEKTPMADVARLLASINESITLKLPFYAGIDIKGIEAWFGEFKKVKKAEIPGVVEKYRHFPAENYAPTGFHEHARVYALRTALGKIGLPLDVPAKSLEKYLEKK
ncbi:DUF2666 family protein [Thermococcus thioreducens]|uniref:DUF2666 domain-containing protein n=1 Tax=Thermococcus thioreducens TaxID=277988 RepID=A0A0Q2UQT8_9EURY|nr:DUF2666 family protein [Thermococcus thioreducens]ASJ12298.1 hypothetical protein A3L14_05070 [Thermococcus thioreducens]KQH83032.1 hypothetical protein AMR53_02065 [Thermococcus thioreducens]SEV93301.1 Protein of unknown function [Thermococcus thioreducens]